MFTKNIFYKFNMILVRTLLVELTNLQPNYQYGYRVKTIHNNDESEFSLMNYFRSYTMKLKNCVLKICFNKLSERF